jgi:hypothetical protein
MTKSLLPQALNLHEFRPYMTNIMQYGYLSMPDLSDHSQLQNLQHVLTGSLNPLI